MTPVDPAQHPKAVWTSSDVTAVTSSDFGDPEPNPGFVEELEKLSVQKLKAAAASRRKRRKPATTETALTCLGVHFILGLSSSKCCTECHANVHIHYPNQTKHRMVWMNTQADQQFDPTMQNMAYVCCFVRSYVERVNTFGGWGRYLVAKAKGIESTGGELLPPVEENNFSVGMLTKKFPGIFVALTPLTARMNAPPFASVDDATMWTPSPSLETIALASLPNGQLLRAEVCFNPHCESCGWDPWKYWSVRLNAWINSQQYYYIDNALHLSREIEANDYPPGSKGHMVPEWGIYYTDPPLIDEAWGYSYAINPFFYSVVNVNSTRYYIEFMTEQGPIGTLPPPLAARVLITHSKVTMEAEDY